MLTLIKMTKQNLAYHINFRFQSYDYHFHNYITFTITQKLLYHVRQTSQSSKNKLNMFKNADKHEFVFSLAIVTTLNNIFIFIF